MGDIQEDEPPPPVPQTGPTCTNTNISLRRLDPDDIVTVKRLHHEWFPIKYGDDFYKPLFQDAFRSTIQPGHSYSVAAVNSDNQIVGLLTAQCTKEYLCEDAGLLKWSFSDQDVVYITTLGVVHEHRGRGIATKLLEDLIMRCTIEDKSVTITAEIGPTKENTSKFTWVSSLLPPPSAPHAVKAVYLHVLTSNSAAVRFYEKSKFMRLRTVPYFYEIDNESHDSHLYIFYLNDGHPPNLPNLLGFVQNKLSRVHQAASSAWFEFTSMFCL